MVKRYNKRKLAQKMRKYGQTRKYSKTWWKVKTSYSHRKIWKFSGFGRHNLEKLWKSRRKTILGSNHKNRSPPGLGELFRNGFKKIRRNIQKVWEAATWKVGNFYENWQMLGADEEDGVKKTLFQLCNSSCEIRVRRCESAATVIRFPEIWKQDRLTI